jgi:hypothetical protein
MSGLSRELVDHRLPIKHDLGHLSKDQEHFIQTYFLGLRTKFTDSWRLTLLGLASMQGGSLILC